MGVGMGRRTITHETFAFVPKMITVAADEPPPAVCFAHFACYAFCVAGGARRLSLSTSRSVRHSPSPACSVLAGHVDDVPESQESSRQTSSMIAVHVGDAPPSLLIHELWHGVGSFSP